MIVIFHVIAALASLIFTSYIYFRPSATKLKISYSLTAVTLGSGFYLVWSAPEHMLQSCVMGLFYVAIVSVGTVAARGKLAQLQLTHAKNEV